MSSHIAGWRMGTSCVFLSVLFPVSFKLHSLRCCAEYRSFGDFGVESGYLVRDANDTAGRAGTSVTGLLGLLVATLAEIVGAGVDNNGALSCVSSRPRIAIQVALHSPFRYSELWKQEARGKGSGKWGLRNG